MIVNDVLEVTPARFLSVSKPAGANQMVQFSVSVHGSILSMGTPDRTTRHISCGTMSAAGKKVFLHIHIQRGNLTQVIDHSQTSLPLLSGLPMDVPRSQTSNLTSATTASTRRHRAAHICA